MIAPRVVSPRCLRVAGLFAGIGGIELGLARAGHHAGLLCEIEPGARAVLAARFPGVPLVPDVRAIEELPPDTELVAAGFPCQDLSQAGATRGIRGKQSGLVDEVFRLLDRRRVPWLLLENVPFMLHLEGGAGIDWLVTNLERLGYRWAYRVLDGICFGTPQRRQRVYLLAALDRDPAGVLLPGSVPESPHQDHRGKACGFYWTEGLRGLGWAVDAVPTLKGGSTIGIPSPPAIWFPDGRIMTPDIRDAERLQGFAPDWTVPACEVMRPGHRWKLVGNAVNVLAAEWLGRRLSAGTDGPVPEGRPLPAGGPWPKAARGGQDGRFAVETSLWPVFVPRPSLADFLLYPARPLSSRAARGFVSRLRRSRLSYPPEFLEALESHIDRLDGGRFERMAAHA